MNMHEYANSESLACLHAMWENSGRQENLVLLHHDRVHVLQFGSKF